LVLHRKHSPFFPRRKRGARAMGKPRPTRCGVRGFGGLGTSKTLGKYTVPKWGGGKFGNTHHGVHWDDQRMPQQTPVARTVFIGPPIHRKGCPAGQGAPGGPASSPWGNGWQFVGGGGGEPPNCRGGSGKIRGTQRETPRGAHWGGGRGEPHRSSAGPSGHTNRGGETGKGGLGRAALALRGGPRGDFRKPEQKGPGISRVVFFRFSPGARITGSKGTKNKKKSVRGGGGFQRN